MVIRIGQYVDDWKQGYHFPDPNKVEPKSNPSSGYSIIGSKYSPISTGIGPGSMAADPILYERQLERTIKEVRQSPGKMIVHGLTQVGMFMQNVHGTVWNPLSAAPPPILQNFLRPALDIPSEGTGDMQVQLKSLIDASIKNIPTNPNGRFELDKGVTSKNSQPSLSKIKNKSNLVRTFDNIKNVLANGISGNNTIEDPLKNTIFANGIIPVRLKGDNDFGFRTFRKKQGDGTADDDVYVPLSFTDLRPVGDTFRSVYFRPMITNLTEMLAPEWNKSSYFGRVDSVATYRSTSRTINLGFMLVAFGPEDIRTIYQKLHWLSSMVYPEYDSNLNYRSGPVVRMRIGDVINALGPEGSRGLPGIIESMDYDYTESIWELSDGYRLPRNIKVSLTFNVLHDKPIGVGQEGRFGGLGTLDTDGNFKAKKTNSTAGNELPSVDSIGFRMFGKGEQVTYNKLSTVDSEKV